MKHSNHITKIVFFISAILRNRYSRIPGKLSILGVYWDYSLTRFSIAVIFKGGLSNRSPCHLLHDCLSPNQFHCSRDLVESLSHKSQSPALFCAFPGVQNVPTSSDT